ncbi:MAG: hypothetical protein NZ879_07345 [Archaeoglobaceae archaeon]|nr:hypothetical protein [Archaeoglobaceae archaeon]MDW8118780.1 hypothetical protein [Archaeoglobaceae archaeon]
MNDRTKAYLPFPKDLHVILNLLSVNTKWNRDKVVEFLESYEVDTFFLDLPSSFEPYFAKKLSPPADVSYSQDLIASEPIIQFCWRKGIPIYCYLDDKVSEDRREIQLEFARLVLKSKITEKINVLEWKELIYRDLYVRESSSEFVAMKICENAGNKNACLNLSPEIEKFLQNEGFEIERIRLYDFQRPIDKLYELASKEMHGEKVSNEAYLELIKKHIAFIDTVVEVGYEDACKFIWI